MSSKVAIIVRTKDRPILLKRCLDSISKQVYKDWEVMLVNNGGEVEVVESVVASFDKEFRDRIILISLATPEYMEFATNMGILKSESSYITLLDDDDTWDPFFLKKCIDILEVNPQTDGVVTRASLVHEVIEADDIKVCSINVFNPSLKKLRLSDLARCNRFTTNSFVYRRSILGATGLYCANLPVLGDWEFNIRFCFKGKIEVIPVPLSYYHKRIQETRKNYSNSDLESHIKYDSLIRKKHVKESFKQGKYSFSILLIFGHFINFFVRKIKKLAFSKGADKYER